MAQKPFLMTTIRKVIVSVVLLHRIGRRRVMPSQGTTKGSSSPDATRVWHRQVIKDEILGERTAFFFYHRWKIQGCTCLLCADKTNTF